MVFLSLFPSLLSLPSLPPSLSLPSSPSLPLPHFPPSLPLPLSLSLPLPPFLSLPPSLSSSLSPSPLTFTIAFSPNLITSVSLPGGKQTENASLAAPELGG